ncbi:hypothetical protein SAMN05660226_03992 [Parapedobacter luteus]|uniref:Response regulatory domain-containing protein n=2 Tax=Parapedobacter luteus TaxID=623280 RepID=A0A1T5FHW0_9SPHI|nr:hypothetical protein SAMN05660226_03992 [Parapedobacter luteus]
MNLIIKDEYPVIRVGLSRLIKNHGCRKVLSCASITETRDAVLGAPAPVDLLIFGMHQDEVRDIGKLITTANIHWKGNGLRVLVLSELYEFLYAPLCISAGAKGFVSMHENHRMILSAVKAVSLNGIFVNPLLESHPIIQCAAGKSGLDG